MTDAPAPAPVVDNAPPAPPPPAPAAVSWRDTLPDDLKANTSLSKFETIEGLAKSYTNLETMLGKDKVPVPKDGDTEGWERYYKAGGRPEKPEEYGFAKPEKLPDGMEYSPELDGRIGKAFHKAGLNKSQAAAVRNELIAIMAEGQEAQSSQSQIAVSDGEAKLKSQWGRAYDQNMQIAKSELKKRGSPEFVAFLESSGLGNHPEMASLLYNIAKDTRGENELVTGREKVQTPLEIDAEISNHARAHQAALFDSSHPEHALRTRERTALFEKKFAGNG